MKSYWLRANCVFVIELHASYFFSVHIVLFHGVQTDIKPRQISVIALKFSKHLLLPRIKLISVKGVETASEI